MFSLWAVTVLDLMRSVVEEHIQRETFVTRNTLIRLSGWALAIGGVGLSFGLAALVLDSETNLLRIGGTLGDLANYGFFIGPIGVAIGLLGLQARYGDRVGGLGRAALLLGGILGGTMVVIGDVMQSEAVGMWDPGFSIFFIGVLLMFVCLLVYGILAIRSSPMTRWNGLPMIAGIPVSLMGIVIVISGPSSGPTELMDPVAIAWGAGYVLMGASLAMLGYLVQSDLSDEITGEPVGA